MYPPGLVDRVAQARLAEFERQAASDRQAAHAAKPRRPRSTPTRRRRHQPWRALPGLLLARIGNRRRGRPATYRLRRRY